MMIHYNEKIAVTGGRQAASVQTGITAIFIMAPVVLMVAAIIFTIAFPMKKKEFDIVKRDVRRRKGEDDSKATAEEVKVIEKVTGFKYDRLWNKDNALKFKERT